MASVVGTATGGAVAAAPGRAAAAPATQTYAAVEDSFASSARAAQVFGGSRFLVAAGTKSDNMVTYIRFNVDKLPAGRGVAKAELRITRSAKSWPKAVTVAKAASPIWGQQYLSWKNRPKVGANVSTVRPTATASELRFDLSAAVRSAGTYSFVLTGTYSASPAQFHSSEAGARGPRLVVTPTTTATGRVDPQPPAATNPGNCTVDARLVPTCGVLWGGAAGAFNGKPRDEEMLKWERKVGRSGGIFHTYHHGYETFPTKREIEMVRDPRNPRLLLTNWKVAQYSTWAKVAAGEQNARIDRLAAHIKANFSEKFLLVLSHEPDNEVKPQAGSGMTAKDFRAMFRYTVKRMKAKGVHNALFTMVYMNYEPTNTSSWWRDLYPGDDVVDWLGMDSYLNAQPGGFHNGDFTNLMNRTTDEAKFMGWYNWATTKHPGKPLILAEWGVYDSSPTKNPVNKAKIFDTVLPQLKNFPALKAISYFDAARDQGGRDIRMDESPQSLAAFRRIAADPRFNVRIR